MDEPIRILRSINLKVESALNDAEFYTVGDLVLLEDEMGTTEFCSYLSNILGIRNLTFDSISRSRLANELREIRAAYRDEYHRYMASVYKIDLDLVKAKAKANDKSKSNERSKSKPKFQAYSTMDNIDAIVDKLEKKLRDGKIRYCQCRH